MKLVVREALLSFRRAPTLSVLSVVTIAFALFVVGLFGLVAINLRAALSDIEERVEIVMYLRTGTPDDVALAALYDIETFPEVDSVTYVTAAEALERARSELAEFRDVFGEFVDNNPLPSSLEIRLKPGYRDEASATRVATQLQGFRFAEDIRFGRDWIARLDRLRDIAAIVGLVIGGAFALASVIIIGTTIRMTVLQRAREISIMRVVGATDSFIRRPFLLEGAIKGTIGGLAALGLTYGIYEAVKRVLLFSAEYFVDYQMAGLVAVGTALGFISSAVSVGKHLKRV